MPAPKTKGKCGFQNIYNNHIFLSPPDIDECDLGTDTCNRAPEAHEECVNNDGSFSCECQDGYKAGGGGYGACENVDECADDASNDCDDNAQCTDTEGSYECECMEGFEGNGFQCIGMCYIIIFQKMP